MNFLSATSPLPQLLQAAATAWKRRDYQRGIEMLERACQLAPSRPELWFDLARCHGFCYNYKTAEECFEKGIRVTGWKTESLLEAGRRCLVFSQNEMAKKYFARALKQDGNSTEALMRLAYIHLRHNQLGDALRLADQIIHLEKNFTPALLLRVTLHRLAGERVEAENLLRSFMTKSELDVRTRAESWYELGTLLDLQHRYDDAMAAFLEAKKMVRAMMPQDTVAVEVRRQNVKKAAKTISTDMLKRWRDAAASDESAKRFALLCGHPRSGTTLLEQILDSHPEIISIEETDIFNEEALLPLTQASPQESIFTGLDIAPNSQVHKSRSAYFHCSERFLGQSLGNRLLVDKNPSLTSLIPAVVRIIPEAKFIIAIRDPRDVCISCFTQPLMPVTPVSEVYLTLESTAAAYASVMGLWQMLKPLMTHSFQEVRYEDLVDNLEAVARRTLEFLEVPWNSRVLEFQKLSQNKLVRSPTYADVRKPVTKRAVGRWRNYQKYIEPCLPILEPLVKAFGYE